MAGETPEPVQTWAVEIDSRFFAFEQCSQRLQEPIGTRSSRTVRAIC
jgi:hypothetical protein